MNDHPGESQQEGGGPAIILVEPQLGENIGAAARAMWNFGLDRLRLVAPRDGWPNPKAVATASGAGRLLDEARLFAATPEAVADLDTVYATTARPRELVKRVLTPEEAMAEARALMAEGARVGVLFGRERTGLENADVILADAVITVPVNPRFPSLNLAQCVLLVAYEWRRRRARAPRGAAEAAARLVPAPKEEIEHLLAHLVAELEAAQFFHPPEKRPAMEAGLRNLFHRLGLTAQEVRTLRGVIRALAEGPRRRR